MNKIISILTFFQEGLDNIWVLISTFSVITILPIIVFLIFYKIGKKFTNDKLNKAYITILITEFLLFIIYFLTFFCLSKFNLVEYNLVDCSVASAIVLTITMFAHMCIWFVVYLIMSILKLFKKIKLHKKIVKVVNNNYNYVVDNSINYSVTNKVSKFTSDYIKSFIKPGVTIDRVEVLEQNKQDYIHKLSEIFNSEDSQNEIDCNKVAEFYYNYYIKSWTK